MNVTCMCGRWFGLLPLGTRLRITQTRNGMCLYHELLYPGMNEWTG